MVKWYQTTSQQDDIVVSTRVRLARNIKSLPFKNKITKQQQIELNDKVRHALEQANLGENAFDFIYLEQLNDLEQLALVEKHLVSHNFIEDPTNKMVAITKDNSISIMVNEEDHIRIQVLQSGLDLQHAFDTCNKIDDLLDEQLEYAFDERLGYLTFCPTNLGTGLRASVMLHLPALEQSRIIPQLISTVSKLGLTIRGTYGEGTKAIGSTYQLSNQVTLGLSEQTAIENLENVIMQIIDSEKATRKEVLKNNIEVIDEICRSYGILKNAMLMSSNEFYELVSNVRLGISENIIKDVKISALNELLNLIGTASICVNNNKAYSPKERDYHRAKLIKEMLM
ncbi:protein arginine kinase [Paludicola sp. MB14-C6]|uniref:protein arginine kinase n=1 Tax=Paludihabitans sp. MB14-C6 TaxID=3070656 RepID=UPI0027DD9982|nr:protein arginine kinase [Paludicola sp. MB14-C6]WMJ23101.1 protein arginine kinase [Paludicola sp. MB14-C6]